MGALEQWFRPPTLTPAMATSSVAAPAEAASSARAADTWPEGKYRTIVWSR
jgi:hypothetical protein